MTEGKRQKLKRKLQEARFRLLSRDPSFAAPLLGMLYVVTEDVYRVSTNGTCMYFDAAWLDRLGAQSLDYTLCHQLMHLKLGHLERSRLYRGDRYHFACNVIVNAKLRNMDFPEEKLPGVGEIRCTTLFPCVDAGELTPEEAFHMSPLDPASLTPTRRKNIMADSDTWWDRPQDRGEQGIIILCPEDPDPEDLRLPAHIRDIVGKYRKGTGHLDIKKVPLRANERKERENDQEDFETEYTTKPGADPLETIQELRDLKVSDEAGSSPSFSERVIQRKRVPSRDWRMLLNHFLRDETRDYDFAPPDRRMQELDFFLPDFNERTTPRLRVLFMIDISISLKEREISTALSEVTVAIEQFNGMLEGAVGFFDTQVRRVLPLNADILDRISLQGDGGTDFGCIFEYVRETRDICLPSEIVILTDGRADFPPLERTMNIPVLWLLTDARVRVPWGQAAYFNESTG